MCFDSNLLHLLYFLSSKRNSKIIKLYLHAFLKNYQLAKKDRSLIYQGRSNLSGSKCYGKLLFWVISNFAEVIIIK